MSKKSFFTTLTLSTSLISANAALLEPPYAIPTYATTGTASWPAESEWQALNVSVGGKLQTLRPWAAVCYTSDPSYDAERCQAVLSNYNNDLTREGVPSALLWPNWEACGFNHGCPLNHSNPQLVSDAVCHQGTTPPYGISISSAQEASTIVKWATMNEVKLTIKNTGHDYLGRSSGPSTLQVNTHGLDDITFIPKFVPQGSSAAPVPAMKFGAGAQLYNIYSFAGKNKVSAVLGACTTVGADPLAGGWFQGGGHGVLTPAYGLGADHILEVELVTADGQIRTVNQYQDADLFWAIRGGGPGSWGVVISATIETLPEMSISASLLVVEANPVQDAKTLGVDFISLVGKYQNEWINSGITTSFVFFQNKYILSLYWPTPSTPLSILYPFFDNLNALSGNYTVASNNTASPMFPTVTAAEQENIGPFFDSTSFYGASTELASRLVPQPYLDPSKPDSITRVAEAIWEGLQTINVVLKEQPEGALSTESAAFILGDMPAVTRNKSMATGANPGLYEASWHVTFASAWTVGVSRETDETLVEAIRRATDPLSALGFAGSYQNEGSAWEENWQEAFFGHKYSSLLKIKQKYDPRNFFSTYKGVGSVTDSPEFHCYKRDLEKSGGLKRVLGYVGSMFGESSKERAEL
ncbi:FAD-binding domain-containing protein [Gyrodon lividus]|nr:FAD-binding domain-containing protein [Gyrodon lividus]